MRRFTAAALQLGPASETMAETLARILTLIDGAARAGATLAVLPELALSPYFASAVHDDPAVLDPHLDETANADALAAIAARAAGHGMSVVASWAERRDGGIFNTMSFFDPTGAEAGKFRKVHIPGFTEPKPELQTTILEKRYFRPGDLGFGVFDLDGLKAGGLICYDRRFPESYRSLMMAGAEVFCVAFNTPVLNDGTLERGRAAARMAVCGGAFFNSTHAIAAGKAGVEGGTRYIGDSLICGPEGEILAHAQTEGDEVVIAVIDLDRQDRLRAEWDFRANLRPEAYRAG
ncbi:nitrilase-related carbon-nitrogen hydrolase [Neotabrizicola sp. VNH66]|uniref:nitrilase-related carbon-nitrogen hydrolase n=1 Tax=Neotabrizicola sp. VNH66 TaxID=3400918 RepID=UPI003BFEC6CF